MHTRCLHVSFAASKSKFVSSESSEIRTDNHSVIAGCCRRSNCRDWSHHWGHPLCHELVIFRVSLPFYPLQGYMLTLAIRVLVHFGDLPGFWKFMYRVSPFTYLISTLVSTGLGNTAVTCSPLEIITLDTPSGETCRQYLVAFMEIAGGNLLNPDATQQCQYCSIATTTPLLASLGSLYSDRWRDLGYLWVYVCFNAGAALFFYWLARVPKQWGRMVSIFQPSVI